MFKSLRNKLVMLYTISTGFILIIVMIFLLIVTEKQLEENRVDDFQSHGDTIINKLYNEKRISHSWLSQLEARNNLIIHIEDNGNPLHFKGVLHVPTDRDRLIKHLKNLALNEGINTERNPIFFNIVKSSVFTLKGDSNEIYYGLVVIIPTEEGWRTLSLLQYHPNYYSPIIKQRILYSLLGLGGIMALFFVSLGFVSRMLKPMVENSRRQTAFIASASHELRSPLSVIMANSAAITEASYETQTLLKGIDRECKRMARLIDDMLLLACMDTKSWYVKNEPIEVDTLLVETFETFLPLFRQNELNLKLDLYEGELPKIYGDKDRLKQVLAILLDNALSYTPPGKTVTLRGLLSNRHLNIEVEDQGIGISDIDKKFIFDRFYRADKSRNDKKHFGLGLCIANELVQRHGGKILVEDTHGGGATFIVRLRV